MITHSEMNNPKVLVFIKWNYSLIKSHNMQELPARNAEQCTLKTQYLCFSMFHNVNNVNFFAEMESRCPGFKNSV